MSKEAFGVVDSVKYAFNAMLVHWKKLFVLYVALMIPIGGSALLFSAFGDSMQSAGVVKSSVAVGLCLIFLLIALWGVAVCARASLRIYDDKSFNVDDVVSSTRYMLPILGVWGFGLLYGAVVLGVFFGSAAYKSFLGMVLGVLGILFGIWLLVRTWLSTFFIVDKGYGPRQALVSSYQVTKGKFRLLMGIYIVALGIVPLVCALPLTLVGTMLEGVSSYVSQFSMLVAGCAYQVITGWMFWLAYGYVYRQLTESQGVHESPESHEEWRSNLYGTRQSS